MPAANAGPFVARIALGGMCMFVPESDGSVMYVLMPKMTGMAGGPHGEHPQTGGGGHHDRMPSMEAHHVVLAYDTAYEQQGGTTKTDRFRVHRLDGYVANVGGNLGGRPTTSPIDAVVTLDESLCFNGASRRHVVSPNEEEVACRVELRAGGPPPRIASGRADVCFVDRHARDKGCRTMIEYVPWTIDGVGQGDAVSLAALLEVTPLATAAGSDPSPQLVLPTLYPIDGALELIILHAVDRALPSDGGPMPLNPGVAPAHFSGYYALGAAMDCGPVKAVMKNDPTKSYMMPSAVCMPTQSRFAS